jgi:hypothetical protein
MEKHMKEPSEFDKFNVTMQKLIRVPHETIKAKLEAEKAAKKRKPKKTSASGRVSGKD